MFRYRLHSPDGDDLGEATYAQMIKPGEESSPAATSTSAWSTLSRSRRRTSRRSSGCYRSRPRKAIYTQRMLERATTRAFPLLNRAAEIAPATQACCGACRTAEAW